MSNFFKHKIRSKSPCKIIGMVIFGIIAAAGLAILFGFIIMWLWNWLMPEIFGLTTLNYWQAVGIFILFKILLGGCNFGSDKSSKNSKRECKSNSKGDFSKWKHYDNFWKEEGNKAYEEYINRINKETNLDD